MDLSEKLPLMTHQQPERKPFDFAIEFLKTFHLQMQTPTSQQIYLMQYPNADINYILESVAKSVNCLIDNNT